ncbi:MAG: hypothetical protein ACPHXR_07740, partial [Flavicella sp.]
MINIIPLSKLRLNFTRNFLFTLLFFVKTFVFAYVDTPASFLAPLSNSKAENSNAFVLSYFDTAVYKKITGNSQVIKNSGAFIANVSNIAQNKVVEAEVATDAFSWVSGLKNLYAKVYAMVVSLNDNDGDGVIDEDDLDDDNDGILDSVESSFITTTTPSQSAVEFDGSDYLQQTTNNSLENPLILSSTGSGDSNVTSGMTANNGQPWAISIVFKPSVRKNMVLWSQTNGSDQNASKISLELLSGGKIRFQYGGNNNYVRWTSNFNYDADSWYAYYVDYNGGDFSGGSCNTCWNRYYSRFRIWRVNLISGQATNLSASSSYGSWSKNQNPPQSSIPGNFYVGAQYNGGVSFEGLISNTIVTTLTVGTSLPSASEVSMMSLDPLSWLSTYKEGNDWRKPNQINTNTANFQSHPTDDSLGGIATKIWLMGDVNSGSGTGIVNQVNPGQTDSEVELPGSTNLPDIVTIEVEYRDTDNDGTYDQFDTDSDNDGCSDALEAGFLDADGDGVVDGDGSGYTIDGKVNGADAYRTPLDRDQNGMFDYIESSFDFCSIDTDEDGVVDLTDLDDDNDGILDTDEGFDTSTNTSWASAYQFDGGQERFDKNSNSNSQNPLRRNNKGSNSVAAGKTAATGRPWAVASVFKADGNSNSTIWSQGGQDDQIHLRVLTDGKLFMKMGESAVNRIRFTSDDAIFSDNWVAVYVDYNGGRTKTANGLTQSDIQSRFRFFKIDLRTGEKSTISGSWKFNSSGEGFDGNITGDFYIGTRDEGTLSDYFNGQIAGVTVTTLKTGDDLPSDAEIALMTLDPKQWLSSKEGQTYRRPHENSDHSSTFSLDDSNSANATQVYLFGDGATNGNSGQLVNQVSSSNTNSRLNGNNLSDLDDQVAVTFFSTTQIDTDNDGIPNQLDIDSDGDGCYDVTEAGFDLNQDGIIDGIVDGNGKLVVDADGKVAGQLPSGNSWYVTTPLDSDNSGLGDHLEADVDQDCNPLELTTISNFEDLTKEEGDAAFDLSSTTTSNSSGAITYTFTLDSDALGTSITPQGVVTIGAAGTVTITANVAGTATHASATKSVTLTINPMVDADGDGVADKNDLDADNDGILDTVECGENTDYLEFSRLETSSNDTYSLLDTQITIGISGGINADHTDDSGNLALDSAGVLRTLTVSTDNPVDFLISQATNTGINFGTVDTWTLTLGDGSLTWEDPSSELNVISSTDTSIQFRASETNPEGWQIKLNNVTNYNLTLLSAYKSDLNVQVTVPCLDTDSDNEANYLETDSDADGCEDYQEAGFDIDKNGVIDNASIDGNGVYTVDADGKIQGHDYTKTPLDSDSSGVHDYLEALVNDACVPSITFEDVYTTENALNFALNATSSSAGSITYSIEGTNTTGTSLSGTNNSTVSVGTEGS